MAKKWVIIKVDAKRRGQERREVYIDGERASEVDEQIIIDIILRLRK